MAIHDLTVNLREGMTIYPGDPPFTREVVSTVADGCALSKLHLGAHTGTHVDAPAHMVEGGSTIDAIPHDVLVGPALVVEVTHPRRITREELTTHHWDGVERVLFRTGNAGSLGRSFRKDYVYLDEEAARFLADKGVRLVGVDYLSVDPPGSQGHPAHMALCNAGMVIIEGLDLSHVSPGRYELICAPLKVKDGDGAPARVFLRDL